MSPAAALIIGAVAVGVAYCIAFAIAAVLDVLGITWSAAREAKAHRDEAASLRFGADVHRRRSR